MKLTRFIELLQEEADKGNGPLHVYYESYNNDFSETNWPVGKISIAKSSVTGEDVVLVGDADG